MTRTAAVALVALTLLAGQASLALGSPSKKFPNCKALNNVYPHGVGRVGARDKSKGKTKYEPVTNFKRSNKLYRENKARDGDGDGVACEKA